MSDYTKYPRTFHLPYSLGITNDDKVLKSTEWFSGMDVVVTEKMDGENTTLYRNHTHARSLDSRHHPSRDWLKGFWGNIRYQIPRGHRICGENLYAKHSIKYEKLDSYFYGFSMWNIENICLSWEDTIEYFIGLNIVSVPVLYKGVYDEKIIQELWNDSMQDECEGYVVRNAESFNYDEFGKNVAKFVRQAHVTSNEHWMHQVIVVNKLRK